MRMPRGILQTDSLQITLLGLRHIPLLSRRLLLLPSRHHLYRKTRLLTPLHPLSLQTLSSSNLPTAHLHFDRYHTESIQSP